MKEDFEEYFEEIEEPDELYIGMPVSYRIKNIILYGVIESIDNNGVCVRYNEGSGLSRGYFSNVEIIKGEIISK